MLMSRIQTCAFTVRVVRVNICGKLLVVLGLYIFVIQYSATGIPKAINVDGFEVHTAVTLKMTLCSLGNAYRRSGGTYCVILQVFLRLRQYVPPKRR
jgi:hypothetical protein